MKELKTRARRTTAVMAVLTCLVAACGAWIEPVAEAVEKDDFVGYRLEGDWVVFVFDASQYETVTRSDTGAPVPMADVELIATSRVAVAGEFNGWATGGWGMELIRKNLYELRVVREKIGGQGSYAFKFVIDGMLWVEPPEGAANAVPTGLGNRSFNLLLVLSEPEPGKVPEAKEVREPEPRAQTTADGLSRGRCSVKPGEAAEPTGDAPAATSIVLVESHRLERLTPPSELLEGICSLKPLEHLVGAAPIPVAANPMITPDRRVIGFVSMIAMPPTPEEEAAWEAEASKAEEGSFLERLDELMAERTAGVVNAYVAIYESSARGPETGVFALEFEKPLSAERREALAVKGPGGAVLAGDHVVAAVWTDDSNAACMDAVHAHVAAALGE